MTHAHIGESFHKKYKLLDFTPFIDSAGKKGKAIKNKKLIDDRIIYYHDANVLMQDISDSTAVYVGAPNREMQFDYFIGEDKTYVGQPDYIFFNKKTKKYFVVEENSILYQGNFQVGLKNLDMI